MGMQTHTQRTIARLYEAASFLQLHSGLFDKWDYAVERNSELEYEKITYLDVAAYAGRVHVNVYGPEADVLMAEVRRAIGGTWEKQFPGDMLILNRKVNDMLTVSMSATREVVCQKIVKGVENVTVPAVPAVPEHVVTREIVEWNCNAILGHPHANEDA